MISQGRLLPVLGGMLITLSLAHASATDDAYISGYAAAALKHDLKLDMPALAEKDA